jgi:hypothetical protein
MPAPFAESDKGVDLNHFRGTIYQLRGMADLGHTAPHLVGNQESIAYTEKDGRIHLLSLVQGTWMDEDISALVPTAPLAVGDPAAVGVGSEQILLYRAADANIYGLTRSLTDVNAGWSLSTSGSPTVDDPFALTSGNELHAVYWGGVFGQIHLSRSAAGAWNFEQAANLGAATPPPNASGSGVAYFHQNELHVVSRGGVDGHLVDLVNAGPASTHVDLTATAHDAGGQAPPAATYRPAIYTPAGGAPRIVFRAVRGNIWQIERDTLVAKNLSVDAGHAPPSAGSPTAVVADKVHVLYRTMDGVIIGMFDDAGVWRRFNVCADAAADPAAFLDSLGRAAVSFRTTDGAVRVAKFVNGAWKCEDALPPRSGPGVAMDPGIVA